MPEDTFEDIRERLFEAAWELPTYAPDHDRVVVRARRRVATTIAGAALAALTAIVVAASAFPFDGERTGTRPVPVDDREFVVEVDTRTIREVHSIQAGAWLFELSPTENRIAFTSDRDGRPQIWVANGDGSDARPVTSDPREASDPDWSPDGREIVYTGWGRGSGRDLFLLDVETGHTRRLTRSEPDEFNADWSPDGTKILYHRAVQGLLPPEMPPGVASGPPPSQRIEVLDVRTGQVTVVAGGPMNIAFDGAWLSDDEIVFMKGVDVRLRDPQRWELWTTTLDGTERRELTDVPSDHWAWGAVVSPDRTRIAFGSDLEEGPWILLYDLRTDEIVRIVPGWYAIWLDDRRLLTQRRPG